MQVCIELFVGRESVEDVNVAEVVTREEVCGGDVLRVWAKGNPVVGFDKLFEREGFEVFAAGRRC